MKTVAGGSGLTRYQDGKFNSFAAEIAGTTLAGGVTAITEDRAGRIWFGFWNGAYYLENGQFREFKTGFEQRPTINDIHEDANGALWFGSNVGAFQILEDAAGNLWMSSNRGIYRVAKQQLNDFADGKISRIESIAYGKADGLLETECNGGQQPAGIRARDGKLWFPTQRGVAVIDPSVIKTNPLAPPVAVESIEIDNESFPVSDKIEIAPGKNNLQINYTALSFVKPELVTFRYKLGGHCDFGY